MEENNDSVYNLITGLCENFFTAPEKIKSVRSSCYEVLLKKKICKDPRIYKDLEGTREPMLNLLAWCYKLTQEYGFSESAEELEKWVQKLKEAYGPDIGSFNNVLIFLLCLKDLPRKTSNKLDLSTLPEIDDQISRYNDLFRLPIFLINDSHHESQSCDLFKLSHEPRTIRSGTFQVKYGTKDLNKSETLKDEGYSSPDKDSIWDVASKITYSKKRNWENYGYGPPDKEKPFLSELGELSSLWVENLESLYLATNLFPSFTLISNKMKPRIVFIRDLKYLLVGMPSETFNLSSEEDFFISPGIMVEGITPDAIERFCSGFLFSGTCYRALNKMATPNPNTRKYKYHGYVFTEFCESLSRYLQFYRTAVFSIPDETHFLTIHEKTYQIQMQILTLASVCKIGPYASNTEHMPHGVALLNYLYQEVLGLSDKNLCMVLYSILYPCCQIYFSRFLLQWLTKGSLNDPYGEFFITPNLKYLSTRGRTYWTRSYGIREDIIPDFLIDLKNDILFCGKIMNLLQLCTSMNKLCVFLMGKNPLLLTCCLTHDKLTQLEQNSSKYYLEASLECGAKFSFARILQRSRESDIAYLRLISKKRAATLRRIELERQRAAQEQHEKRMEELLMLKEQYESALEQKQLNIYKEIEKEIVTMQENLKIEHMREKLVEEEAARMIEYYNELCQVAESRKKQIESYLKTVSHIHIDTTIAEKDQFKSLENIVAGKANSSSDSYYSAPDDHESSDVEKEKCEPVQLERAIRSSESMDLLNANVETKVNAESDAPESLRSSKEDISQLKEPANANIQQALDNFELARKIKRKVLNQELGIHIGDWTREPAQTIKENIGGTLTAAQQNKLKILSSEFGIDVIRGNIKTDRILTVAQVNRNKVLGHNQCFIPHYEKNVLDNENFVNKNLKYIGETTDVKLSSPIKKSRSLQLDFDKISMKCDSDKPIPMSVDSTPLSDLPPTATPLSDFPRSTTPSSMFMSVDTKLDSFPTTAETHQTEDIFSFGSSSRITCTSLNNEKPQESHAIPIFSKRVTVKEAKGISKNSLKLFLHESISIPLLTQLKLANNEILKYFVEELHYLDHLGSLRDYFFLQDGEFGRSITENLFEKLYGANFPLELINCRTLQHLVFSALDNSSRFQENSKHLSFKINSLPKCFDLGDPDVLDCLSLTYKLGWPLNILLPSDSVAKYDQVFKFLVKLNRVSWVLKKIFLELKVLAKETGKKEIYLMSSPQYRHLHQCRHVMSHFMQTLQNYIVGEVLQPSWEMFERSLTDVTNLDELYNAHTAYIKNIIFRCMLNQKSVTLRNIIHKIFVVILKFYDYLRSRQWLCEDGSYVHPNFNKLDRIFKNFEEFIIYFFRVVRKVAKSGYQPHLTQFLDVLDVNSYYSKKLLKASSKTAHEDS